MGNKPLFGNLTYLKNMLICNGFIVKDTNNDMSSLETAVSLLSSEFAATGIFNWDGRVLIDENFNDRYFSLPEPMSGANAIKVYEILRTNGIDMIPKAIGNDTEFTNFVPFEYEYRHTFTNEELIALGDETFRLQPRIQNLKDQLASYTKAAKAEIDALAAKYDELSQEYQSRGKDMKVQAVKEIDFLAKTVRIWNADGSLITTVDAGMADLNQKHTTVYRASQLVLQDFVHPDATPQQRKDDLPFE